MCRWSRRKRTLTSTRLSLPGMFFCLALLAPHLCPLCLLSHHTLDPPPHDRYILLFNSDFLNAAVCFYSAYAVIPHFYAGRITNAVVREHPKTFSPFHLPGLSRSVSATFLLCSFIYESSHFYTHFSAIGFLSVAVASFIGTLRFGFAPSTFASANQFFALLAGKVGIPVMAISLIQWRDFQHVFPISPLGFDIKVRPKLMQ